MFSETEAKNLLDVIPKLTLDVSDWKTDYIKTTLRSYENEIDEKINSADTPSEEWGTLTGKYIQCLEFLADQFVNVIRENVMKNCLLLGEEAIDAIIEYFSNPETYTNDAERQAIALAIITLLCDPAVFN